MIREAGQVQNKLGSSPFLSLEKHDLLESYYRFTGTLEPGTREPLLEKI